MSTRSFSNAEIVVPVAVAIEVTRSNKPGSQELKDSELPVIELTEEENVLAQQLCHHYGIEVVGRRKRLLFASHGDTTCSSPTTLKHGV